MYAGSGLGGGGCTFPLFGLFTYFRFQATTCLSCRHLFIPDSNINNNLEINGQCLYQDFAFARAEVLDAETLSRFALGSMQRI